MTIHQAYRQLLAQLYELYDNREAAGISDWVMEYVTGQTKINRIIYKDLQVNKGQEEQLKYITGKLLQHAPVQYVLNEAWFAGIKLYVDENVLIPRPETEELVEWLITDAAEMTEALSKNIQQPSNNDQNSILDVGTGSGCIAIALKKKLSGQNIYAVDISQEALKVAEKNAIAQDAVIQFISLNFLKEEQWHHLPDFDIVISNPPYVKKSEENVMRKNVLEYEPHMALFVPDEDPLIFYRALAKFGVTHLKQNGFLYVEINETLAENVATLFRTTGYNDIVLKKDMHGKDRMIRASK